MPTYEIVNDPGQARAPALIVSFEDWVDAGGAGTTAARHIAGDGVVTLADRLSRGRRPGAASTLEMSACTRKRRASPRDVAEMSRCRRRRPRKVVNWEKTSARCPASSAASLTVIASPDFLWMVSG